MRFDDLYDIRNIDVIRQRLRALGAGASHEQRVLAMGEPAHNLDAVLDAIERLGSAGGIGHKNLVFCARAQPALR